MSRILYPPNRNLDESWNLLKLLKMPDKQARNGGVLAYQKNTGPECIGAPTWIWKKKIGPNMTNLSHLMNAVRCVCIREHVSANISSVGHKPSLYTLLCTLSYTSIWPVFINILYNTKWGIHGPPFIHQVKRAEGESDVIDYMGPQLFVCMS